MGKKPKTFEGYESQQTEQVRRTCLYVATKLGDLMDDLLIIGGLVPSLIVEQTSLPTGTEPHVGTMDLDIGLTLALLDEEHYKELTERLRDADFVMDTNDKGNPTRQRWVVRDARSVTVDFLIPPVEDAKAQKRLFDIEPDLAPVIAPSLRCALRDRTPVRIDGETIEGKQVSRTVSVCGPGGFIVMKALAHAGRAENKDAYDLYYVVRNYGNGPADVASHLAPLLDDEDAVRAIGILKSDFDEPNKLGPRNVAEFLTGGVDDDIQLDVVGFVAQLLSYLDLD